MSRIESRSFDPLEDGRIKPIKRVTEASLEQHRRTIEESIEAAEETKEQQLRGQMEELDAELHIHYLTGDAFERNRAAYKILKDQLPK